MSVRVDDDRLVGSDGLLVGILLCDEVDLLGWETWRREAAVDAVESLLQGLATELVLTVRVRRHRFHAEVAGGSMPGLDHAVDLHWRRRLEGAPAYHRRVVATVRHPSARELERELGRVAAGLAAAGIPTRRLVGAELGRHLQDGGLDLGRVAWVDQARQAWVGDRLARAAILDHLPGGSVDTGWLAALVRAPVECDIALHLVPTSSRLATGLLSRRMRHLGAHQLLERERGLVPDAAGGDGARGRPAPPRPAGAQHRTPTPSLADGGRPGRRRGPLDLAWGRLRAAFGATLAACRAGHFEHLSGSLAAWGLGSPPGPGKLVDSRAAASCAPWLQTSIEDPGRLPDRTDGRQRPAGERRPLRRGPATPTPTSGSSPRRGRARAS